MQHVEDSVKVLGFLDSGDIRRFLDHAHQSLVARGTGAIRARVDIGDVIADRAKAETGFHVTNSSGQGLCVIVAGAQNVKRQPLRTLRADARQLFQFVDQARHGFRESRHRKLESRLVNTGSIILPADPTEVRMHEDRLGPPITVPCITATVGQHSKQFDKNSIHGSILQPVFFHRRQQFDLLHRWADEFSTGNPIPAHKRR